MTSSLPAWVAAPSHQQKLDTSGAVARASSEHATACWHTLVRAVQSNRSLHESRVAFDQAVANQAYAWAVHHAVIADAPGPTAVDGHTTDARHP